MGCGWSNLGRPGVQPYLLIGCFQVDGLASHLNPVSEYLQGIISRLEPKRRLHRTTCISRGRSDAILKKRRRFSGMSRVGSTKPSVKNTTSANAKLA